MDYNDVSSRIKRLYSSIDERYEDDVLQHMQSKTEQAEDGHFIVTIDFNAKHNEDETINRINGIISNLANLKDHLKTKLKLRGADPEVIETEINKDLSLQLVIDLNNQEKHGYPLKKPRSWKNPKVVNIKKALSVRPGVQATAFIRDPTTGAGATNNMVIVISADVVDGNGNQIFHLNDLIDRSLSAWEKIIAQNSLG